MDLEKIKLQLREFSKKVIPKKYKLYVMYFLKTIYFYRILGIIVSIIFFIPTTSALGHFSHSHFSLGELIPIFLVSLFAFLIIYGIPINIFVQNQKNHAKLPLGIRLVKEVNKIHNVTEPWKTLWQPVPGSSDNLSGKVPDYKRFNEKNGEHLLLVKDYIVHGLTGMYKDSSDEIKNIDKKIEEFRNTIEEEKSTTDALIEKHPFIKTLQELQNRSN